MELEIHIAHLLKSHNCVIVPNFGGFIANHESAYVNKAASIIFPPRKQILFNGNLTQNDGLLASEIVNQQKLDYPNALSQIERCAAIWRKSLDDGDRIELNEIGFLYKQGDKIVFEQNRETNLLLQSYGFKQISFVSFEIEEKVSNPILRPKEIRPVQKESIKEKTRITTPVIQLDTTSTVENVVQKTDNKNSNVITLPKEKKKSSRLKYVAIAAAIIPIAFYSYWIPMQTDFLATGKIQYGDFNPFNNSANKLYQTRTAELINEKENNWKSWEELTENLPSDLQIYNYEFSDELYIPVNLNREIVVEGYDINAPYHLIAGCFSIKSNANQFVKDLKANGYTAEIIDKNNGLYRVGAGFYSNMIDAENALSKYKAQGKSGWILKH